MNIFFLYIGDLMVNFLYVYMNVLFLFALVYVVAERGVALLYMYVCEHEQL
jgi:hypothetical protein